MFRRLRALESDGKCLSVGIIGAGAMGRGIALQVHATPAMSVAWIADVDEAAAQTAAALAGQCCTTTDVLGTIADRRVDVVVEATNSIEDAARYCLAAFAAGSHVVLMNAEVDLAVGPELVAAALANGVQVTSDAGDQHGVLATMIDEAQLWGLRIVQAGNIKGFLDTEATPESIRHEAEQRNLSATQCCAYTDGTKLHIEMAVLANGFGFLPPDEGMTGPRCADVTEALGLFDFDSYGDTARIDYILGAQPGGGVYLIVECPEGTPNEQKFLLNYYKLGDGPYYLLYRPYHLCHLETVRAIAQVALDHAPVLQPWAGPITDVYSYAKCDLAVGQTISHAIGSAEVRGEVLPTTSATASGQISIVLLESEATITQAIAKGEPLTHDNVTISDGTVAQLRQSHRTPESE